MGRRGPICSSIRERLAELRCYPSCGTNPELHNSSETLTKCGSPHPCGLTGAAMANEACRRLSESRPAKIRSVIATSRLMNGE